MRIYDPANDVALRELILYLTLDEAKELTSGLRQMLERASVNDHIHLNDIEYSHEIILAVYDEANLKGFNERSIKLIREDR
ncbi:hypothetical protein ANRL1_04383 [Anaerolineae bacterium]|nr:hypothetical protein ANRL1_04383 [Anaerolineae bacterium]